MAATRANTIITFYKDEVARNATITIQTGVDPGDANYGPEVLADDNPAQVAKIDSTTGAWLLQFPSPQRIDFASLIHHDFDAPGGSPPPSVKLQANTSNSWGSPAFEADFVIPQWFAPGTNRKWPINPWLDLTSVTPAIGSYNTTGWEWWRLLVSNNSQNLQLGGLKLYQAFYVFLADMQAGWVRTQEKPLIVNTTAFQVQTKYTRGTTVWRSEGSLLARTSQMSDLEGHWYDIDGSALPFVVVPNQFRNRCYFVDKITDDFAETVPFYDQANDNELIAFPFAVKERGRGLRPGN